MNRKSVRVLLLVCLLVSVAIYIKNSHGISGIRRISNSTTSKVISRETGVTPGLHNQSFDGAKILPLLTLFTTWKNTKEKAIVIRNTIQNWRTFHPNISTVVFSNSVKRLHRYARKHGWKIWKSKTVTEDKIPLFRDMFIQAMKQQSSVFYGYANSDILFTPSLMKTLQKIDSFKQNNTSPILVVGQRIDFSVVNISFPNNFSYIVKKGLHNGKLNEPDAIDYFIISKDFPLKDFPDVVVGRIAYDNYVIMHARAHRVAVIDATKTIPAIHQTTRAGNMEGHMQRNKLYNKELLNKEFDITNYLGGLTTCANYESVRNSSTNGINLIRRKSKPGYCVKMFESW
ncbi:hypothetical protein FSP39_011922 [Pinctada imbricata]|uniref:Uncharacterized protein n=1 Tax=Pinctada imbricata TaxID=66713 RepID=A0AA88YME5_PINIB|nr:hypothetical protein FSP39_011922 [Pinctada imbricata]